MTRLCLDRLGTLLQHEIALASGAPEGRLRALHERVRRARYAPAAPDAETCARLIADARALLAPRRGSRASAGMVLLALLGAAAPLRAVQAEPGLGAFQPTEAERAVRVLAAAVRAQPDDATAWYNLGHAFSAREQRGWAAWAWLRTLQLEPRATDARQNLRALGAQQALAALAPRVPLASDELRLLAALAWWLATTFLLAGMRARRPGPLRAASAGLALVALLALAALAGRARPATRAVALERVVLRAAPALRADSVATVPATAPLRLGDVRGEWARVTDPEGRDGWLERALLGRL